MARLMRKSIMDDIIKGKNLDRHLKEIKFKKIQDVILATPPGSIKTLRAHGWFYKGILIHRIEKRYRVTHTASGMGLHYLDQKCLKDAKILCIRLAEIFNFEESNTHTLIASITARFKSVNAAFKDLKNNPHTDLSEYSEEV